MYLEDISNEALKSIARGHMRREVEQGRTAPTFAASLSAMKYCYLQLLKIQNAELEIEAVFNHNAPEA